MKFKKLKNTILTFLLIFIFTCTFSNFHVFAEGDTLNLEAKSALLMEPNSGKIIYEKNSHEKLPPASVTKIMTMLITMEKIDSGKIKLTDKVTISENAKKMGGSSMLLDTGEVRTVEELLKGIAIASGNDAAVAMAEYIGGSEEAFVKLMNERAQQLGMKDTTFKNCTGLSSPGHITSAYDISIMSRELLKHPGILKYTGTYMETISEGRKSPIGLVNHNKLVRFFKGCDGLKTGFTDEAKYCISATAVRDDVRMLTVVMGSSTYKVRNKEASQLLNYGFSKYSSEKVIIKNNPVGKVYLNKGKDDFYNVVAKEDFFVAIEKGKKSNIEKKCVITNNNSKIMKGEKVGYCGVYIDGVLLKKVTIYTDREVKKSGLLKNIRKGFMKIVQN